MANEYYPLRLRAVAKEKIWGGHNLTRLLGKTFATQEAIGETWEAWDGCVIENGAHQGATLGDLIERDTAGILGDVPGGARFPLLFKFIDAQDDLSVQVHPNDAQAQQFENYPFGKTEAWYILHAEPGATLIHGFKNDVTFEQVRDALAQNRLQDLLAHVPVQTGDVVFVPAGIVHAIMRGIVLAEIQENSDITYRLYDWGRIGKGRDLHIEQSLRVANFNGVSEHKILRLTIQHAEGAQHFLVACRYLAFELLEARAPMRLATNNRFQILSIIRGAASIADVYAGLGQTIVVPARMGVFTIAPAEAACQILRAYVPDLSRDVIAPLTQAGFSLEQIAQLGGTLPNANDLRGAFSSI
jgi:mannose-6-phosphate isomerase